MFVTYKVEQAEVSKLFSGINKKDRQPTDISCYAKCRQELAITLLHYISCNKNLKTL